MLIWSSIVNGTADPQELQLKAPPEKSAGLSVFLELSNPRNFLQRLTAIESACARGIEGFRARNYLELSCSSQTLMREENR